MYIYSARLDFLGRGSAITQNCSRFVCIYTRLPIHISFLPFTPCTHSVLPRYTFCFNCRPSIPRPRFTVAAWCTCVYCINMHPRNNNPPDFSFPCLVAERFGCRWAWSYVHKNKLISTTPKSHVWSRACLVVRGVRGNVQAPPQRHKEVSPVVYNVIDTIG